MHKLNVQSAVTDDNEYWQPYVIISIIDMDAACRWVLCKEKCQWVLSLYSFDFKIHRPKERLNDLILKYTAYVCLSIMIVL